MVVGVKPQPPLARIPLRNQDLPSHSQSAGPGSVRGAWQGHLVDADSKSPRSITSSPGSGGDLQRLDCPDKVVTTFSVLL